MWRQYIMNLRAVLCWPLTALLLMVSPSHHVLSTNPTECSMFTITGIYPMERHPSARSASAVMWCQYILTLRAVLCWSLTKKMVVSVNIHLTVVSFSAVQANLLDLLSWWPLKRVGLRHLINVWVSDILSWKQFLTLKFVDSRVGHVDRSSWHLKLRYRLLNKCPTKNVQVFVHFKVGCRTWLFRTIKLYKNKGSSYYLISHLQ